MFFDTSAFLKVSCMIGTCWWQNVDLKKFFPFLLFSFPFFGRCRTHRQHGHMDLKNKRCKFSGCMKIPSYGSYAENEGRFDASNVFPLPSTSHPLLRCSIRISAAKRRDLNVLRLLWFLRICIQIPLLNLMHSMSEDLFPFNIAVRSHPLILRQEIEYLHVLLSRIQQGVHHALLVPYLLSLDTAFSPYIHPFVLLCVITVLKCNEESCIFCDDFFVHLYSWSSFLNGHLYMYPAAYYSPEEKARKTFLWSLLILFPVHLSLRIFLSPPSRASLPILMTCL